MVARLSYSFRCGRHAVTTQQDHHKRLLSSFRCGRHRYDEAAGSSQAWTGHFMNGRLTLQICTSLPQRQSRSAFRKPKHMLAAGRLQADTSFCTGLYVEGALPQWPPSGRPVAAPVAAQWLPSGRP